MGGRSGGGRGVDASPGAPRFTGAATVRVAGGTAVAEALEPAMLARAFGLDPLARQEVAR